MPTDPLVRSCADAARQLRRMPSELRRAMGKHVATQVAQPLADRVLAARDSRARAVGVKVRGGEQPQLVVGGAARVVSGGAAGRQLFYGLEFGGGRGYRAYTGRSPRGRSYQLRRRVTAQFPRPPVHAFLFDTFAREADQVSEDWLAVLDPFLTAWEAG